MSQPRREPVEDLAGTAPLAQQLPEAPLHGFRPWRTKQLVIGAIGLVMVGWGIASLVEMSGPDLRGSEARALGTVVGVGVILLVLAFVIRTRRLLITPSSVIRVRWRERESCRWEEVAEVVMTSIKVRLTTSPVCILMKKDGTRFELREFDGAGDESVLAALRREAESRGIAWREEAAGALPPDSSPRAVGGVLGGSKERLIGLVLSISIGPLGYLCVYKPLDSAWGGAPTVSISLKGVLFAPFGLIGLMYVALGPRARTVMGTRQKPTPAAWVISISVVLVGIGLYLWLRSTIEAHGYHFKDLTTATKKTLP